MRESSVALGFGLAHDAKHPQTHCDRNTMRAKTDSQQHATLPASSAYSRQQVLDWLENSVPPKRLHHILQVEKFSTELAQHHGLDPARAAQAGLMHDLAKCFKPKRLLSLAAEHGVAIDAVFAANPHLLHADVGAIVAQTEFGIQDADVLAAIRNHTLGDVNMSQLSCVVFLADTLEPGRGDTPDLHRLRELCWQDLHHAVWHTSDYTLRYLLEAKQLIHPRAILTRNWAMQRATGKPIPPVTP